MPTRIPTHCIVRPAGFRSPEAGLFVAQFDELTANTWTDLAGMTAAELAWQPRRGANTAGMLLAHMAIVEVFWIQRAGEGFDEARMRRAIGLGRDGDGMPVPPDGRPPAELRGWTLRDFRALHARARAHTRRAVRTWAPRELERGVDHTLRDGRRMRFNVRWILHHLLEHYAGHCGQILLLRHLYRDRRRGR